MLYIATLIRKEYFLNKANLIIEEVNKVIIGKEKVIRKVWMTILSGGHVLLEDVPGVGKTTMALAFSKALGLSYRRIQFTPDVMPSDVVGFYYYNKENGKFEYRQGAVMTNLLLADEINRTSSRTQSALLEVMEEGQVTVDGVTRNIQEPFFVIATQNPFGSAGTQLLPDSQLDRFMTRLSLGYPSVNDEVAIMKTRQIINPLESVQAILSPEDILRFQKEIDQIFISDEIYYYIAALIDATRHHELITQGASPRGSLALMKLSKANAFMHGRDYVIPDDVKAVAIMTLAHRLILNYDAKIKETSAEAIITDILERIPTPGIHL